MHLVAEKHCAFVHYMTRAAAELAIEHCHNGILIKGKLAKVAWGRPKPLGPSNETRRNYESSSRSNSKKPPLPPGTEEGNLRYPSQGAFSYPHFI